MDAATSMEQALEYLKSDKGGYQLVSPPQGLRKKWQARTSGKACGQRSLGCFSSEEDAAKQVVLWILEASLTWRHGGIDLEASTWRHR